MVIPQNRRAETQPQRAWDRGVVIPKSLSPEFRVRSLETDYQTLVKKG